MRGKIILAIELLLICGSLKAQITTSTTLTSVTPSAPLFGQAVTLTAQVVPAGAPGTVSFMDNGVFFGVGTLNSSGIAQMTTLTLPSGTHSLRAVYTDAGGYQPSQSASRSYIVTPVAGGGVAAGVGYAASGPALYAVAVGDFNGDGIADLVVGDQTTPPCCSYSMGKLSVMLGNGNGTFQTATDFLIGGRYAQAVAFGDFNGDGKADVAVASDDGVRIVLGLGNGLIQGIVHPNPNYGGRSLAVGDFNGDGKMDLVVGNEISNVVSVLLGNGDINATFRTAVNYDVGAYPDSIAVGDFNGDEKADLAVANHASQNVSVLLGNGDGTFNTAVDYSAGVGPTAVATADFNGDGIADLVVVNSFDGTASVLLGNGNGTFKTAVNYPVGASPQAVAVGDINGDGKADLTVTNNSSGANTTGVVSVLLGNGDGTFKPAVNYPATASPNPLSVALGDFNGDGIVDLAVTDSGKVDVLLGTAPPSTTTTISANPNPSRYGQSVTLTARVTPSNASGRVEFLDGTVFVGTGTLDLSGQSQITTSQLASGTRELRAVYQGIPGVWGRSQSGVVDQVVNAIGGTGFSPPATYPAGDHPTFVTVGDFNGDGIADLAVANTLYYNGELYGLDTIGVLLGTGNGTFQPAVNYLAGVGIVSLAVGDFNGDGKADLVAANYFGNGVSVLLGKGDGTFQTAVPYAAGDSPQSVAPGDFNGDGKADLAVANYLGGNVSILPGNGDGTFQQPLNYSAGSGPYSVMVGDFNGDGKADLAVVHNPGNIVSVLLGNGNGTFQPVANYTFGSSVVAAAVGDFNGDGKADLAVTYAITNYAVPQYYVSVLLGKADGTFQSAVSYFVVYPGSVAVGDFNGDGKVDLVVANGSCSSCYPGTVGVLLGNGDGTFQPFRRWSDFDGVGGYLAVGDFNGDGTADLAGIMAATGIQPTGGVGILLGMGPASVAGVAPNTGSGAVQTFVGSYSSAFGWVEMLFAVAPDGGGQSYCLVHYDVYNNSFWLYGDGGFFVGPITPGTPSNLLQNSLCAFNTSASSVTTQIGGTLTLSVNLVFKAAGARNIYLRAQNKGGADTGWVQQGTWTTSAAALGTMTVSPSSGSSTSGVEQTFTLTYADPPGFLGLASGWEQFLVAAAPNGGGQPFCFVHYDRAGNGLWMYSSDLGFFLGPVTPGTASNALSSSACSVNTAGTTVQNSNGSLVLTVPIKLKATMAGAKNTYQRTLDVLQQNSGFVPTGSWTIN